MLSIKVVSNNVKVSNKVVKPDNWHYISSSDNPADTAKGKYFLRLTICALHQGYLILIVKYAIKFL